MKKFLIGFAFVIGYLSLVITAAAVAVPSYLNYQGLLRDSAGNVVTGSKDMTFKIYSSLTGGSALWTMTSAGVSVSNGLYTVKLGPLTSTDLGSGSRWLEVMVGTETLTPRLEILSVAYAITAGTIGSVDYATLAGTATTAASATKLGTYLPGVSGVSIVPTTDATTGKLSTSVIPTGVTMDYTTLSGTATNAGTVDNIHASTEAVASNLLALDSNKVFKGAAISAEATSGYGLFVKSGKIGMASGTGATPGSVSCGTGTVPILTTDGFTVTNNAVTDNSLIFLSIGPTTNVMEAIKVDSRSAGTFTVKKIDSGAAPASAIPFSYLIIN